jgi:hypothetical protein
MAEKAGPLHPHHNLSSSAKAGDPCRGTIMAGGARALDLRLRGDDEALHTPHRIACAIRLPRKGGVCVPPPIFYVRSRECPPSPGGRGLGAGDKRVGEGKRRRRGGGHQAPPAPRKSPDPCRKRGIFYLTPHAAASGGNRHAAGGVTQ